MTGLVILLLAVAAATAFGLWRRRTDGRVRDVAALPGTAHHRLTAGDLGGALGHRATLVQFSSQFCQPCRVTTARLTGLVGGRSDLRLVELDVEDHHGLVRELRVRRTPTVLVLDASGTERHRVTGVPRQQDLLAAIAALP